MRPCSLRRTRASYHSVSFTQFGDHTWSCCTSTHSNPKLLRLFSVCSTTHFLGNTSRTGALGGGGHCMFLGGTFVATASFPLCSRTTLPTSCSERPCP